MLPAHFLLCVLSCIAFSGGEWVAKVKIELENLKVNHKYGTLTFHTDQRSADTFLNNGISFSKCIPLVYHLFFFIFTVLNN